LGGAEWDGDNRRGAERGRGRGFGGGVGSGQGGIEVKRGGRRAEVGGGRGVDAKLQWGKMSAFSLVKNCLLV